MICLWKLDRVLCWLVIVGLAKDGASVHAVECHIESPAYSGAQAARGNGVAASCAICPPTWVYTAKECLTELEFDVLCSVKAYLEGNGVGIVSKGTLQDSLSDMQGKSLVVFAFFPTPQLMRGSSDAWLHGLVAHAAQNGQALTLIVVHSKQFLQRLQPDPVLFLEKGIVAEPPFPVASMHRFEQELLKNHKARLYKKAGSKLSGSSSSAGVGVVTFKNVHAVLCSEDWASLMGNSAAQVAFFGEGAGLGMLSVSGLVSASAGSTSSTKALLDLATHKLQAERVTPDTTKVPWSEVLPHLNGRAGITSMGTDLLKLKRAEEELAVDDPIAKRAKVGHQRGQ